MLSVSPPGRRPHSAVCPLRLGAGCQARRSRARRERAIPSGGRALALAGSPAGWLGGAPKIKKSGTDWANRAAAGRPICVLCVCATSARPSFRDGDRWGGGIAQIRQRAAALLYGRYVLRTPYSVLRTHTSRRKDEQKLLAPPPVSTLCSVCCNMCAYRADLLLTHSHIQLTYARTPTRTLCHDAISFEADTSTYNVMMAGVYLGSTSSQLGPELRSRPGAAAHWRRRRWWWWLNFTRRAGQPSSQPASPPRLSLTDRSVGALCC